MDTAQSSLDLLSHFDGPTPVNSRVRVTGVEQSDPPVCWGLPAVDPSHPGNAPSRGVGWVLQWATALAVLSLAAGVLAEFGYSLAAELQLARAARAAAFEATLPRASTYTIADVIQRRLADNRTIVEALQTTIQQNGMPIRGQLRAADGDRITITLAVHADAALPSWLRAVRFWRHDSQIIARAERQMPRRHL